MALVILAIGKVSIGPAAAAQTYDPAYPALPLRVPQGGQLLRMPLHVAASVQRIGIGPCGAVFHQSIFRERGRSHGLSAASPRPLNL